MWSLRIHRPAETKDRMVRHVHAHEQRARINGDIDADTMTGFRLRKSFRSAVAETASRLASRRPVIL